MPCAAALPERPCAMTSNPSTISPELFKIINADVSEYIRKKLLAMNIEVVDLELHNSSLTKTLRV